MIIGYSILYVNEDTTIKDVLWERRVVYSNWEESLKKARERAEKEREENGDNCKYVSLIKSDSQKNSDKYGSCCIYKINDKQIGMIGEIFIVPVYNE
jgi:hypothetical protein